MPNQINAKCRSLFPPCLFFLYIFKTHSPSPLFQFLMYLLLVLSFSFISSFFGQVRDDNLNSQCHTSRICEYKYIYIYMASSNHLELLPIYKTHTVSPCFTLFSPRHIAAHSAPCTQSASPPARPLPSLSGCSLDPSPSSRRRHRNASPRHAATETAEELVGGGGWSVFLGLSFECFGWVHNLFIGLNPAKKKNKYMLT